MLIPLQVTCLLASRLIHNISAFANPPTRFSCGSFPKLTLPIFQGIGQSHLALAKFLQTCPESVEGRASSCKPSTYKSF